MGRGRHANFATGAVGGAPYGAMKRVRGVMTMMAMMCDDDDVDDGGDDANDDVVDDDGDDDDDGEGKAPAGLPPSCSLTCHHIARSLATLSPGDSLPSRPEQVSRRLGGTETCHEVSRRLGACPWEACHQAVRRQC